MRNIMCFIGLHIYKKRRYISSESKYYSMVYEVKSCTNCNKTKKGSKKFIYKSTSHKEAMKYVRDINLQPPGYGVIISL